MVTLLGLPLRPLSSTALKVYHNEKIIHVGDGGPKTTKERKKNEGIINNC